MTNEMIQEITRIVEEKVAIQYADKIANINSVGMHKIATRLHPEYGQAESLDLTKAITVLGTKLAMIHLENNSIINGLMQLKDLEADRGN